MAATKRWPRLKSYRGAFLRRVAMPIGGIGTGTVSLGGRGDLRDWELMNRPAKGHTPGNAYLALKVGEFVRCLEGPLPPEDYEGGSGAAFANHGLPRFAEAEFHAAYPLAEVALRDPDCPLKVRLQAFNPMVPGDSASSSLPVAVLRMVLENPLDRPQTASTLFCLPNIIGFDGGGGEAKANRNAFAAVGGVPALRMHSEGVPAEAEGWGTMALALVGASEVSHRLGYAVRSWGDSLLDLWDDFSADGRMEPRDPGDVAMPIGGLAGSVTVPAKGAVALTYVFAWHFPNRYAWQPRGNGAKAVGNWYATQYADAAAVLEHVLPRLDTLEERTVRFVRTFLGSSFPDVVKEAALFNASTLRTQTAFRIGDGTLMGWEGCSDRNGCCHGSCTHVWNYEHTTAHLYADLARTMRAVEFGPSTAGNGRMAFRSELPLARASEWPTAAADGQMGCLMKLYREWQMSGDDAFLAKLWPSAKRAMEFCWVPNGWDGDQDGVMEGCQHNTMDVEYFGPNPQMGAWYLGALRACEEMGRHVGDDGFADKCRRLYENGRAWMDQNLFNGKWYEHQVRPAKRVENVAAGLRADWSAVQNMQEPELQLGPGCLVDQLVGECMAVAMGLGEMLDLYHVRLTLDTLMEMNFQPSLRAHFNHFRSFALGEEAALLMAWYPPDRRPPRPFPYFNEVMTGFEYTVAVHHLLLGRERDGLRVVKAIRDRYDGRKRSPFNEAECGHHYARAMAAWGCLLAMTGFRYSAVEATMGFARKPGARWFWSNGAAYGTVEQTAAGATLRVVEGEVALKALRIGSAVVELDGTRRVTPNSPLKVVLS